jgi:chorismate mutase
LPQLLSGALLGLVAAAAHAAPSPAPDALQPLLATINERLNIADQVALTKWDSGKPIQDTAREAQVIANARKQAVQQKLDPDEAAELIAAQIEANKLVQYGLLAGKPPARHPTCHGPTLAKSGQNWISCKSACCSNTPISCLIA